MREMKEFKVYYKEENREKLKETVISDMCLFCDAPCCKENFVPLTEEEVKSGAYEMEFKTWLDPETGKMKSCWVLKRKPDGSCIYLTKFNLCSIWKRRPLACRLYTCDKIRKGKEKRNENKDGSLSR